MNSLYEYKFNREKCWYLDICPFKDDVENNCRISCPRYFKMDYLMWASNIPQNMQGREKLMPTASDIKIFERLKEIQKNLTTWVNSGNNLYLYSEGFGNGKTSWALKLLKNYFNSIWQTTDLKCRGIFLSVPVMLRTMKDVINLRNKKDSESIKKVNYYDFIIENISTTDLVIWDDIGYASASDADFKFLSSYIEDRTISRLSNIFTGNLSEESLKNQLGSRLCQRIWNNSEVLEFKGISLRGLK